MDGLLRTVASKRLARTGVYGDSRILRVLASLEVLVERLQHDQHCRQWSRCWQGGYREDKLRAPALTARRLKKTGSWCLISPRASLVLQSASDPVRGVARSAHMVIV